MGKTASVKNPRKGSAVRSVNVPDDRPAKKPPVADPNGNREQRRAWFKLTGRRGS